MAVKNLAELAEHSAERLGERSNSRSTARSSPIGNCSITAGGCTRRLPSWAWPAASRAVVLMMNHALVYPVMQGIFRSGGTAIPVMPQAAAAELRYVLADTEAQFVVTDVDRLPTVREAVGRAGTRARTSWCKAAQTIIQRAAPENCALESLLDYAPANHDCRRSTGRRRGRDALFVRHDRPAQGRAAVARQPVGQRRGGRRRRRARQLGRPAHHGQRHADCAYLRRGDHERPAA